MKCEQCLSNLETGLLWQRFLARRHAQRCPQCARAIEVLATLKRELARCEPLTAHQRRLWERTAVQVTTQPAFQWPVWQLAFARAAAVVACVMVLALFSWSIAPLGKSIQVVKVSTQVVKVDFKPELEKLDRQLASLEAEIAQLSTKAELNDVHQQVLVMIDTYKRW